MTSNSDLFTQLYNDRLGKLTWRPVDPDRAATFRRIAKGNGMPGGIGSITDAISPARAKERAAEARTQKSTTAKNQKAATSFAVKIVKKAYSDSKKRNTAANKIIKAANTAQLSALKIQTDKHPPKKKQSLFGKIGGHVPGVVRTAAKGGLDIISRPSYTVNNALKEGLQAVNAGEPVWSLGDNALHGAVRGATGKAKTGYGQVVEESTKPFTTGDGKTPRAIKEVMPFGLDKLYGGAVLAKVQKDHPVAAQNLKRTYGAIGDVGLDPLTYVGPGVLSKAAKERMALTTAAREAVDAGAEGSVRSVRKALAKEGQQQFSNAVKAHFTEAVANGATEPEARKLSTKFAKTLEARSTPEEIAKQRLKDAIQRSVKRKVDELSPNLRAKEKWTPKEGGGYHFTTVGDKLSEGIDKIIDDSTNAVRSGAQQGKALYGKEMPGQVATRVAEDVRATEMESINKQLKKIKEHIDGTKKLTAAQITNMRKSNKWIDKFWENFQDEAKSVVTTGKSKHQMVADAYDTMKEALDEDITKIQHEVLGEIGPMTHHTPTIRYLTEGGKISERIGNGLAKVDDLYQGSTLAKAFSYKEHFPGYTSMLASKVRSEGVAHFDEFYKEVEDEVKRLGVGKQGRKDVHQALMSGSTLDGNTEELRKFVQDKYKQIYQDEVQYGIRNPSVTPFAKNYVFHYIKNGGRMEEKSLLRKSIKEEAKAGADININATKYMEKAGLKEEDDAVRALLLRKKKSMRDSARMAFNEELIGNYHLVSKNLSEKAANERGLVKIHKDQIPNVLKEKLNPGEEYYLPKKIADVRNVFVKMSKMQGDDTTREILRQIDYVTRKFKTMSTIYYPSYHIRNMMGDMFMGLLDGVKVSDYKEILEKVGKKEDAASKIMLGGESVPYGDVAKAYDESAKASGFYRTDLGKKLSKGKIQSVSEKREDFGRFVHFYHALDEEYSKALKVYGNPDTAFKKAADAARFRVNKYKFDYSAVTPFEQGVMKRAMPFYTYMRKAVPTLAESLFLNPRVLNYTNKILNQLGPKTEQFNDLIAPEWMRSIGYAVMPGNEKNNEPWVMRNDMLPTNIFADLFGVQSSETTSQGLMKNMLSRANPALQVPIELATGKELWSGRPVKNPWDSIQNKMRPVGTIRSAQNKKFSDFLLQQTGVPLQQIKKGSQKRYIEEVRATNQRISRKGFKVFLSGDKYVLKNKKTGTVIKSGHSLKEVLPELLYSTKKEQKFVGAQK